MFWKALHWGWSDIHWFLLWSKSCRGFVAFVNLGENFLVWLHMPKNHLTSPSDLGSLISGSSRWYTSFLRTVRWQLEEVQYDMKYEKHIRLDKDIIMTKFPHLCYRGVWHCQTVQCRLPWQPLDVFLCYLWHEFERMQREDIISRLEGPTDWCADIVMVPKPN